jgi:hypothetical protein
VLAGGALTPADEPLGANFGENDSAIGGDAEAGFEGANERYVQFAQNNGINLHGQKSLTL